MTSNSSTSAVKDLTEENKSFFNEQAATYEHHVAHSRIIQDIGEDVIKRQEWSGVAWDEGSTRMLDYACGTGLISRVLAPYTKQIVGMDLSEGMVEQFNQAVKNQGISKDEMHAIVANLCADEVDPLLSDSKYHDFDVAISTMAFHHFNNVPLAINRIVKRLKPKTGVLLVVDFRTHEKVHFHGRHEYQHHDSHDQHDHHSQQHEHHDAREDVGPFFSGHHTVTHSGFSEDEIKRWYGEAGLVDIEIVDVGPGRGVSIVGKDPKDKVQRSVFMAKGRRA